MAAIDAANAEDPSLIVVDGVARPKELVHADVVERWVRRLAPQASEVQLLAARAHHLRRWVSPRSGHPDGRSGYLRWRAEQKRRQSAEVAELLAGAGQDGAVIERVVALVAKEGAATDPMAQTHEDALCLTFLELQLGEMIERLGHDRAVGVVGKTTSKMSTAGLAMVAELPLVDHERRLVERAVAGP